MLNRLLLILLLALPQQADLAQVLVKADKLLEEAKSSYEAARTAGTVAGFIDAGFRLEEARIKYLVLQEIGTPELQKTAADRLRTVNQLTKLIHDGKVAVGGGKSDRPAEPAPPPEANVKPAPEPEKAPDVLKRHPMPETADIKAAEKQVKDLFKELYAKKTINDRVALARALLAQCAKSGNDLPSLYFMYSDAIEICIQLCDPSSSFVIIDRFARIFDVDVVAARYAAVTASASNAKLVDHSDDLGDCFAIVAEDLAASDLYDLAEKAANAALTHARKANNPLLTARMTTRMKELGEAKARFAAMKSVLEALARSKEDPGPNLEMGQFLCYVKGNWEMGLRFLVKGPDSPLKTLAEREIALREPADLVTIADGWWELGDKEKSPLRKAQLLSHARVVYEQAQPGLTGILQARVEKRMGEFDTAATPPVNLMQSIALPSDAVRAEASFEGRYLVYGAPDWGRIQVGYVPPEEYDLVIVVERKSPEGQFNVLLSNGKSQVIVALDGAKDGVTSGLDQIEGKGFPGNETTFRGKVLPLGTRSVVLCSVRKTGIKVMVNGKKVIEYKGAFTRLNLHGGYAMPSPTALGVGGWGGKYIVSMINLTPVGGQGKKLR